MNPFRKPSAGSRAQPTRRVRCVRVIATLGVLGSLAGCTPAPLPMTALHLVNGHPTLILLSCKDFHATDIIVSTDGITPRESWYARNAGEVMAPGEVQLLTTPTGWKTVEDSLNVFAPNTTYGVSTFSDGPKAVDIVFTLADLTALAPGQVLVGESASRRHPVAESTFRADAHDACN